MERFVKGDIVVIPFPFSDLTQFKRRPAFVIANCDEDYILCQITSVETKERSAIRLSDNDFIEGSLKRVSFIRPSKIFTADRELLLYKVGSVNEEKISEVITALLEIIED